MGINRNRPPVNGSHLHWTKSFFKFFGIAFMLTLPLLFFQNCGQSISTNERMPARSPFAAQRVYLTKPTIAQKIAANQKLEESKENIPVTVIIDNACAAQQCAQDEGSENQPTTCDLIRGRMVPQLSKGLQAYEWEVLADATEASVEKFLNRNQTDQDCIVGLSITRQYKSTQAVDTANPLVKHQYQHEVLRTAEAMAFFDQQNLAPVKVGIVDTGVDFTHEDLSYIPGQVDWPSSSPQCAKICNGHGTFVAGLIAAQKNNGKGGYGIAPNAMIKSYRVGNAEGVIQTAELYNALNWSLQVDHVEIMNLSLGGSGLIDQSIQDAIVRLIQDDTLVVVAAGNDGQNLDDDPIYPAAFNYDGQINVASASPVTVNPTLDGPYNVKGAAIELDKFSNYSAGLVHIAAPGQGVYSTLPNNAYSKWSGTSFSTPLVVGALTVLKGYIKAKGYTNFSAPILKEILLEGSRRINSLDGKVAESKYLDLVLMKDSAEKFLQTMNTSPVQIALISSGTTMIGPTKHVRVQIEVTGGTVGAGQILRAYTNRAFMEDSNTHITCAIVQERQFCTFDIPFDRMYIDPEVYFVLTTANGARIVDLNIPKGNLDFGNRDESTLEGAVVHAKNGPQYMHIEGWACLKGFVDPITVEVRKGSTTGPVVRTLTTIRQARGDYFARCQAPGINFGFTFLVPQGDFDGNQHQYFFKAIHPGTGKTLDLPVMSYHPLSGETRTAEYTNSVLLDPLLNEKPVFKVTKQELVNWVLKVEGTACFPQSKKPAPVIVSLRSGDFIALFPSIQEKLGMTNTPIAVQSEAKIDYYMNGWNLRNPNPHVASTSVSDYTCFAPFSEISMSCMYWGPSGTTNFLVPRSYSQKHPTLGNDLVSNDAFTTTGIASVIPHLNVGDGCPHPSGFVVNLDLNPWVASINFGLGFGYRTDMITKEAILAQLDPEIRAMMGPPPREDFSQITRSSRTLSPFLNIAGFSHNGTGSIKIFKEFYEFNNMSELFTTLNLNPSAIAGAGLDTIYTGPVTPTAPNSTRLLVGLRFNNGVRMGELGIDMRVEFSVNNSGQWYEAPIDLDWSSPEYGTKTYSGYFSADIDLPALTNSIQFRIKANNKNNLILRNLGHLAQ